MLGLGHYCFSPREEFAVLFALVTTLVIGQEAVKNPHTEIGCEDLGVWVVRTDKRSFRATTWAPHSAMSADL